MIERKRLYDEIETALGRSRVVALLGPRQSGKTTLARSFVSPDSTNYFDLEDPVSLARLTEPMTALRDLRGLVVIDEIQQRPELFPILRVLVDRQPLPARFLILGSAAPSFMREPSQSLAGRVETVTIGGFSLAEVGVSEQARLWLRGGFPLSYLANSEQDSVAWRQSFVQTFLERDLPNMGIGAATPLLRRFWAMVAHYHGQVWNAAEPARALGVSETTARRYLDLMEGVFMVRQLPPWYANLTKRQVKAPKVYLRDSGILHLLLGIRTEKELLEHPKSGASWEGFVIKETLQVLKPDESYFWATHNGAELDLLLIKGERRIGIECKRVDAPKLTASMQIALRDLELERLYVIYPGVQQYALNDRVHVVPFSDLALADAAERFGFS